MIHYAYYNFPLGLVEIGCDKAIVSVKRVPARTREHCPTPLSDLAAKQLAEYFAGIRKEFDLPLHIQGTEFQKAVWQTLLDIPYGETRSYGEIAAAIGNPKACRAVGMACNRNPIWIIIPCHRVVGHNKSLTGYEGGLPMKKWLLDLEA